MVTHAKTNPPFGWSFGLRDFCLWMSVTLITIHSNTAGVGVALVGTRLCSVCKYSCTSKFLVDSGF